jgi:CheY-like chemotaxis protein
MQTEPHSPPAILLVEDDPAEVYLLREAFATGPRAVHVHSVPSVAQALAFLRHAAPYGHAPRPQLIVTSIKLPGKSGFDLIAEVKREPALRAIPVIVLSLYDDPGVIQQSYALGANGYIIKPPALEASFKAIHTMVEEWLTVSA